VSEETTTGLPSGPVDREPLGDHHRGAREQEAALRQVLADAGVELGAYDERIVEWFAQFADNGTFNTMVSWVQRAAAGTAPVFEVEQSAADSDGWDPDDPYGDVAEYERNAGR
jgi:hypothetical protein